MNLYHGSNICIEHIDLSFSKRGKDFGCGFYLNPNPEQARVMAERMTRTREEGIATVTVFDFDESILQHSNDLNVKFFNDYSKEWAEFVLLNRKNLTATPAHPYDIVIGPIADDTVGVQLRRYLMGYISIDSLVEELRFRSEPAIQYFFATKEAVKLLNYKGSLR